MKRDEARRRLPGPRFWIVAGPSLLFLVLLAAHVPLVNGPRFWAWPYVSLNLLRTALCFLPGMLLLLLALHRIEHPPAVAGSGGAGPGRRTGHREGPEEGAVLLLLIASNLAFQLGGVLADPRGWGMIAAITSSPAANGYFTEAMDVPGSPWPLLRIYHSVDMNIHAQTHPPGPILFYLACIRLFGSGTAAWLGGCILGIAAAAGVPLMARFASLWTEDRRTCLLAAALYAALPGIVLFFPEFDQVYPLFTMALLFLWMRCLDAPPRSSLLPGAVLLLASFLAYHILSVVFVLLLWTVVFVRRAEDRAGAIGKAAVRGGIVLGVVILGQIAFSAATGYHPVLAFRKALENERLIRLALQRPLGFTLLWDLYDFLLAAAMVPAGLLLLYWRRPGTLPELPGGRPFTIAGLSLPLLLTAGALMHGENARLWLFLQPFLLAPAALPLASCNRREVLGIFLVLWAALVIMKSRLLFVGS